MKLKLFVWPYKVHSAVPGWRGWRLWYVGLEIAEPCEFWQWFEDGELGPDTARIDPTTGETYWYPLCDPTDSCRCCVTGRRQGAHRHTGSIRGSYPIGRFPRGRRA